MDRVFTTIHRVARCLRDKVPAGVQSPITFAKMAVFSGLRRTVSEVSAGNFQCREKWQLGTWCLTSREYRYILINQLYITASLITGQPIIHQFLNQSSEA